MMTIKKIAMQLCLSSAVLAAMPTAFSAEVAPTTQHYMVKNLNIGDLPVKTIVPITAKTAERRASHCPSESDCQQPKRRCG